MGEQRLLRCDGCGITHNLLDAEGRKSIDGWFGVQTIITRESMIENLAEEFSHPTGTFCTIECLLKWAREKSEEEAAVKTTGPTIASERFSPYL